MCLKFKLRIFKKFYKKDIDGIRKYKPRHKKYTSDIFP
jgi:hypothetical protein